jgi:pimeloyl-ACP methyl ester carboxylesterase
MVQIPRELKTIKLPSGTALAYRQWGSGAIPVVFVHGYSLSLTTWDRVGGKLPARYTGYAYDLRGFGDSEHSGSYSYETHARDMLAFLDAMKLDRAVIVGHSLGGNILQEFVLKHPTRVRAMVLADAAARVIAPPDPVANRVAERLALYGDAAANRKVFEIGVPRYFDKKNVTATEIEDWIQVGLKADTNALKDMLAANYSLKPIPAAEFSVLRMPVLIVNGVHDVFSTPEHVKAMTEAMPHATVTLIDAAGHTPMWEKPDAWADAVYGWMDNNVPAGRSS